MPDAKWGGVRWGEVKWGEAAPLGITMVSLVGSSELGSHTVTGGVVSPSTEGWSWDQLRELSEGVPPGKLDTVQTIKNRLWKQFEEET